MPVEAANLADSSSSRPSPAPGARAAEPDAKIAKTSENNSNKDDDDSVPAALDASSWLPLFQRL
ncbi:hypothetical protein DFJ73DRAFT_788628 [Zopfochytrium polystomum]|nr:hypothetical protein DFJ73DRAFT_788628 [Zopfochytrium polystomum]